MKKIFIVMERSGVTESQETVSLNNFIYRIELITFPETAKLQNFKAVCNVFVEGGGASCS